MAGLSAATWLAWTVLAGASGAGAYLANNGDKPLGNSCGDGFGDATATKMNANKNACANDNKTIKLKFQHLLFYICVFVC